MRRARLVGTAAVAMGLVISLVGSPPARAAEPPADAPPPAGSRAAGRALFSGAQRTRNGGPPCGACHAIGGEGPAFAGSLGPDLSKSFEDLPADAVDGLLTDLPFPTMAPLYTGHPLTPAERADLAAFLTTNAGRPAPPDGRRVAGWAAALALACLALMSAAARRHKGSTRARLMARPPAAGGGSR